MENLHSNITQPHIYKITNLVNGKIYVGKTKGSKKSYICSGLTIWNSIKKYGHENFKKEIVVSGDFNNELLNELEKHYIQLFNSTDKKIGYNINKGGHGGNNVEWTEENRKRISNKAKGRVWSEESKSKLSKTLKKKYNSGEMNSKDFLHKWSKESRERLSKTLKRKYTEGSMNMYWGSEKHKEWNSKKFKGTKLSEEHKQKISLGLKKAHQEGKRNSSSWESMKSKENQEKARISIKRKYDSGELIIWNKGLPAHNRKEVIVTDLLGNFVKKDTVSKLGIKGCCNGKWIRACCNGEIESFNGYIFKWAEK